MAFISVYKLWGVIYIGTVLFFLNNISQNTNYNVSFLHAPKTSKPKNANTQILKTVNQKSGIINNSNRNTLDQKHTMTLQNSKMQNRIYPWEGEIFKERLEKKLMDRKRLLFLRIPKTGSITFVKLIWHLSRLRKFSKTSYPHPDHRQLSTVEQDKLMKKITSLKPPAVYDRHVYFTNFTRWNIFLL